MKRSVPLIAALALGLAACASTPPPSRRNNCVRKTPRSRKRCGAELRRLESQVAALQTKEDERGMVLTLGAGVLFDSGQATLKPGARRALGNVARLMQRRSDLDIVVEGFTDNVGGDDMNRALSERRAQAVKCTLVDQGVAAGRIAAQGMGEAFPVASNASPAGRQLNRRVEIVIPREGAATGG